MSYKPRRLGTVYHGTSRSNIEFIEREGLRAKCSDEPIFVTTNFSDAAKFGRFLNKEDPVVYEIGPSEIEQSGARIKRDLRTTHGSYELYDSKPIRPKKRYLVKTDELGNPLSVESVTKLR